MSSRRRLLVLAVAVAAAFALLVGAVSAEVDVSGDTLTVTPSVSGPVTAGEAVTWSVTFVTGVGYGGPVEADVTLPPGLDYSCTTTGTLPELRGRAVTASSGCASATASGPFDPPSPYTAGTDLSGADDTISGAGGELDLEEVPDDMPAGETLTFTIPTTIDANVASEVTGSALGPVAAVMWAAGHTVQVMPAADSVALPLPVQPTPLPTTTATAPTITQSPPVAPPVEVAIGTQAAQIGTAVVSQVESGVGSASPNLSVSLESDPGKLYCSLARKVPKRTPSRRARADGAVTQTPLPRLLLPRASTGAGAVICTSTCAPSDTPASGLYVEVLNGVVNVADASMSQTFAPGQFGFTQTTDEPPVILPPGVAVDAAPPASVNQPPATGSGGPAAAAPVDCVVRVERHHPVAATAARSHAAHPARVAAPRVSAERSAATSGKWEFFPGKCKLTVHGMRCDFGAIPAHAKMDLVLQAPISSLAAGASTPLALTWSSASGSGKVKVLDATSVVAKVPARTVLVPSFKLISTASGAKRTYHFTLGNVGAVTATRVSMCVTAPARGSIVAAPDARVRGARACWPAVKIRSGIARRVTVVVHSTRDLAPKWTASAANASVHTLHAGR